ncbi:MAG: response regulator [Anaerolineae bacterium]
MPSILIVEADPVMRPTLCDLLTLEGYEVRAARSGQEALRQLERHPTDLVITDFILPEMNGLDLLKALRADARWGDTPVLMFTSTADPVVRAQVMEAGADDFLLQPITVQDLLLTVRRRLFRSDLP